MSSTTIIDIIRHGEPEGGRRYRGQIDDPLSEKGWAQMRAAVGERCPWQAIVASPLSRCAAFAAELAERHALPVHHDARLKEVGFGVWEGYTAEALEAAQPGQIERFRLDPIGHRPEGAEALEAFYARVVAAWDDVVAQHAGRHVLVVGHAGVIRMVLAHVLAAPLAHAYRIKVANAGVTRIKVEDCAGGRLASLIFHGGSLKKSA